MKYAAYALCLVAGLGGGWALAQLGKPVEAPVEPVPSDWVARIGDDYVTPAMVQDEMRRRAGTRPGLFQDEAQKRALLDDMLLSRALLAAAREAGLDRQPETRRSIEQLLISQYVRDTLRKQQQGVSVAEEEIKAYFDQHADEYTVPARRRVAMIRIAVAPDAGDDAWAAAEKRASEALKKARTAATSVPHFGAVAREYSEDAASRYRGGVIGWLTEGRREGYRYDPALLEAAFELQEPGDFSPVLRGRDGVYVARLVETQAEQTRAYEQLRAGLEQRLMQERLAVIEQEFRERTLDAAGAQVRESRLAEIKPPGPPATDAPPAPPAMPVDAGAGT
jgi:parvulin-like peptidyl-prolyl isomerase